MNVHALDIWIIVVFLGGTLAYGLWSGRTNRTTKAYFLADRTLPWWAVMLSIVATETSVLTFISLPGIAYRGNWYFLQLGLGYIIGRIAVSQILLNLYYAKGITSIYEYIGQRFSPLVQRITSAIFLITRLLADGVRFFATALLVITLLPLSMGQTVLIIGGVTLIYTLAGGIKTVVWMDTFQFCLYLGAGFISLFYLHRLIDGGIGQGVTTLWDAGKFAMINLDAEDVFNLSVAYTFPAALIGGAFLSFASHGVDYMMVQRVLSTRNIRSAKMALIGSGIFVMIQFSLFMFVGGLIWVLFGGREIGVDQEFPTFIGTYLPVGIKGLLLAGVLAAAMSTLSSSINSLASSTVNDWMKRKDDLKLSRLVSLGWGLMLMGIAMLFESRESSVVEIGLQIASYTYGGLLGLFLLGRTEMQLKWWQLTFGLISAAATVLLLKYFGIAWTWYIVVATFINILVATGLYRLDLLFSSWRVQQ